jgi:hypothetical protein
MCQSHYRSCNHADWKSKNRNAADWKRYRFYKHLRFFILFNFIFLIRAFNGHGLEAWTNLLLIWGPFVLLHYVQVRSSLRPAYASGRGRSDDRFPEDERPTWREKDLVKNPGK